MNPNLSRLGLDGLSISVVCQHANTVTSITLIHPWYANSANRRSAGFMPKTVRLREKGIQINPKTPFFGPFQPPSLPSLKYDSRKALTVPSARVLFSVGEKDTGNIQKKRSERTLLSVNPPLDGDAVCGDYPILRSTVDGTLRFYLYPFSPPAHLSFLFLLFAFSFPTCIYIQLEPTSLKVYVFLIFFI